MDSEPGRIDALSGAIEPSSIGVSSSTFEPRCADALSSDVNPSSVGAPSNACESSCADSSSNAFEPSYADAPSGACGRSCADSIRRAAPARRAGKARRAEPRRRAASVKSASVRVRIQCERAPRNTALRPKGQRAAPKGQPEGTTIFRRDTYFTEGTTHYFSTCNIIKDSL